MEKSLREIVRKERFVEGGDLVRVVRNDCIMIACEKGLKLLTDHADHVFGDGTFQYAPKHFKQMFTLHVIKDNIYVPVLYFLLKNKQQRTYQSMFKVVKEQCPTFNPKVAHFDFEVAIHNAFLQVFPGAEVRGCRFHLAQAWYRKLASLGLQVTYLMGKSKTAVWLKTCFGIPCLPPDAVLEFFKQEMFKESPKHQALDTFINYLNSTYMSPASKFPPKLWAGCLSGDMNNTTNGCENFHRHFGAGCLSPHPSIYDWLSHVNRTNKRHMIRSNGCNNPQKKSHALNKHLLDIFSQFQSNNIDKMTFVKLTSLNCLPKSVRMNNTRSRCVVSSIKKKNMHWL